MHNHTKLFHKSQLVNFVGTWCSIYILYVHWIPENILYTFIHTWHWHLSLCLAISTNYSTSLISFHDKPLHLLQFVQKVQCNKYLKYTAVNIWFKSRTQLLSNFSQQKEISQYLHIKDEVFKFLHVAVVLPWTWIRCLTYNNREIHMEPWNAKFNLSLEKKKPNNNKIIERVIEHEETIKYKWTDKLKHFNCFNFFNSLFEYSG